MLKWEGNFALPSIIQVRSTRPFTDSGRVVNVSIAKRKNWVSNNQKSVTSAPYTFSIRSSTSSLIHLHFNGPNRYMRDFYKCFNADPPAREQAFSSAWPGYVNESKRDMPVDRLANE